MPAPLLKNVSYFFSIFLLPPFGLHTAAGTGKRIKEKTALYVPVSVNLPVSLQEAILYAKKASLHKPAMMFYP